MTAWDPETFEQVANYQTQTILPLATIEETHGAIETHARQGLARLVMAQAAKAGVTVLLEDLAFRVEDEDAAFAFGVRDLRCRWWPAEPDAVLELGPQDGLDVQVVLPAPVFLRVPADPDVVDPEMVTYAVASWDPERRRWIYRPAPDGAGVR